MNGLLYRYDMKDSENDLLHPFDNADKNIPLSVLVQLGFCVLVLHFTRRMVVSANQLPDVYKEAICLVLDTTTHNIRVVCEGSADGSQNEKN